MKTNGGSYIFNVIAVKDKEKNYDHADYGLNARKKLFGKDVVDNSRSMISIINRDYVYEDVNDTFCRAHKNDRSAFVGKSLEDIWGSENFQKKIKPNIDQCFSGKTVKYQATFRIPHKNRGQFNVIFRPVKNTDGSVMHLVADTFDVSRFKQLEIGTGNIRRALEKFESEYKNYLSDGRKSGSAGIPDGGIAHDLNNIMTTIGGYATMLENNLPEGSPERQKASKIIAAVEKAVSLTNQLIIFSKQSKPEIKPVNICDVLGESVGFMRSALPSDIIIKSDFQSLDAFVLGDSTQLFRIFFNLLTNAVQSVEDKGGIINVDLALADMTTKNKIIGKENITGKYIKVIVGDSGKGIDPEILDRVFEPYFTTKKAGKGSGLGLSVVRRLVTDMGGSISVSSKKNVGSSFIIYLPLAEKFPE